MNDCVPPTIPFTVAVWRRRQKRAHQYTPILQDDIAWQYHSPAPNAAEASPSNVDNVHKSHRDLRADKKLHAAQVTSFTDKITADSPPDCRCPSDEMLMHVSHRHFMRAKMAHHLELNRKEYSLDAEPTCLPFM